MRACSCTLSNLEAFAELNSPNVINAIVKRLPPQLQAWWYERVFKHMEKGRKPTFSELTEFIAMKGQVTNFGLDYLTNIKKEDKESRLSVPCATQICQLITLSRH